MRATASSANPSEPLTGETVLQDISVRAFPNPLRDEFLAAVVPAGQTVLEIVGRADLPAVCIADGRVIECDEWSRVVPRETLDVRRIPASGDTGRIIGTIAVLAFAAFAGPYAASALFSGSMVSAGFMAGTGALITAGIGVAGTLLINHLIPPPAIASQGSAPDQLSFLTSQSNQVASFAPIPVPYGHMQWYPPIPMTGLPYTELVGNDQYFRALFVLGYGPLQINGVSTAAGMITAASSPSVASAIKIGGTSIDQFDDVEYQIGDAEDVTLYTGSIVENGVNVSMPEAGTPTARAWFADGTTYTQTTSTDTDEISLDVYFPALFSVNGDNGKIRSAGVRFKVEARKISTSPIGAWTTLLNTWEIESKARAPVRVGKRFVLPSRGQWNVRVTRTSTYLGKTDGVWYTDAIWTTLRSIKRNVRPFDVSGVVVMAMRIRATDQLGGRLERVSVEATRILPVWTTSVSPNAWVDTATRNPAWAYVDVLTGSATRNALAKSRIDLDAITAWADWCAATGLYCDIVIDAQGTVFDRARDVASAGLATWNISDDGSVSIVRDVVQTSKMLISPRNSAEFGHEYTYPDLPHCLRVQFVDGDRWESTERLVYADGYDPDASPHDTATRFEQLQLFGVTDADQAWLMGRYHLSQLTLRPERYTWMQDIGHLVYTRGDSVDLHHDVILVGLKAGRITTIAGNKLSATVDEYLPMTSASPLNAYALRIQLQDGSLITRTITNVYPGTQSVTFGSAATGVEPGDHFIFGISGAETIKAKIMRVEPQGDFQARVVAVPAADNIYDAWTGSVPAFDPVITAPVDQNKTAPATPTIVGVIADTTSSVRDSAGELRVRMAVTFQMPAGTTGVSVHARIRESDVDESTSPATVVYSEWRHAGSAPAGSGVVYIDGVEEEVTYQVQLQAVRGPLVSPWTAAETYAIPDFSQTTIADVAALAAAANLNMVGLSIFEILTGTASASLSIRNDGYIVFDPEHVDGLTSPRPYLLNGAGAADYEVRVDLTSGAVTTGTTGSWLSLATTRTWTAVADSPSEVVQPTGTIKIRKNGVELSSNLFALYAEWLAI